MRMPTIAAIRRRIDYRRIDLMLERERVVMNLKNLRRLYKKGPAAKRCEGR